jgi:tetratricopeptide (TPR) repeat protein
MRSDSLRSSVGACLRFLIALAIPAVLAAGCSTDPNVKKQQYLESGNRYFEEGKYSYAIIEYRNAVDLDAGFGEARKRLAEAYSKNNNVRRAFEESVRAADLLTEDFDVQMTAARYLLQAERFEDALARADTALKIRPQDIDAHILRGYALSGLKSFDQALSAIEEAIKLDPGRGSTFTQLGVLELGRGRAAEAEEAFKNAVALAPKSVEAHLALGNFYWSTGRAKETEQSFQDALSLQPEHTAANRAMAALKIATGKPLDAEQYLRRITDAGSDPNAVLALSDYYLRYRRPKEAIPRLERLVSGEQTIPGAKQRLAVAYLMAGDANKGKALNDEVLAASPRDVAALLLKGQLLENEGRRDEALATVRSVVTANPNSAQAHYALARLYYARGDLGPAQAAFREVVRLNPRAAGAQVELSSLQLSGGDPAGAVRTAQEAIRNQPKSVAARITLVRGLLASKDFGGAERELTALRSEYPDVAVVYALSGTLALLRNDVVRSRAEFEKAQELAPRAIDGIAGLVALDLRAKDLAGAKARVDKRLQEGATPELRLLAARTYIAAQDLAGAERVLREAIEADPSQVLPYAMLAQIYLNQKKLDQARVEFEGLAARQAKPVGALTMTAMILEQQGKVAEARKRYEEVLALDSRAVLASNNLAFLLAESGEDLDKALTLAQASAAAGPEEPELTDTLGWVYYKKDLTDLAVPLLRRNVEKVPRNPSYQHHLGMALLKAGDVQGGRAALERALVIGIDAKRAAEIRKVLADNATR